MTDPDPVVIKKTDPDPAEINKLDLNPEPGEIFHVNNGKGASFFLSPLFGKKNEGMSKFDMIRR